MGERRFGDYRRPGGTPGAGPSATGAPAARRPRRWLRLFSIAAGFGLLGVGVVGLFLPILQGVLLILAGLALLGREFPWARGVTNRLSNFFRRRTARRGRPEAP